MAFILKSSIFLILIGSIFCIQDNLFFVVHLANVGARFPKKIEGPWVKNLGEVTQVGLRQQYLLGRELRELYVNRENFLSERYKSVEVGLRAAYSNWSMTASSAYALTMGLYPPGTGPSLNEDNIKRAVPPNNSTDYSPYIKELRDAALPNFIDTIPIMINGGGNDYVLSAATFCNNLDKFIDEYLDSHNKIKSKKDELTKKGRNGVFVELSKVFGKQIDSIKDALEYRDYLVSAKYFAMPKQISDEGLKDLEEMYIFTNYEEILADEKVNKVISNGLLREIYTEVKESYQVQKEHKKLLSYSLEDSSIFAVLRLLGQNLTTGQVEVPFASSLQFEIRGPEHPINALLDLHVNIVYNGKALVWKNGNERIVLQDFFTWIHESTLKEEDFMSICVKQEEKKSEASGEAAWMVAGLIVCGMIIVMMIFVCIYILGKSKDAGEKAEKEEETTV